MRHPAYLLLQHYDAEPRRKLPKKASNAFEVLSGARNTHVNRKTVCSLVGASLLEEQAARLNAGGRALVRGITRTNSDHSYHSSPADPDGVLAG